MSGRYVIIKEGGETGEGHVVSGEDRTSAAVGHVCCGDAGWGGGVWYEDVMEGD